MRCCAAVVDMADATLRHELGRLVEAEILFARGEPPSATYTFKHALVQEAAYESLLEAHAPTAPRPRRRKRSWSSFRRRPRLRRRCSPATAQPAACCPKRSRPTDRQATRPPHGSPTRRRRATSPRHSSCSPRFPRTPRATPRRSNCAWRTSAPVGALRGYEDPELVASIERVEGLLAAIGTGPQQIPGLLKLAMLHTNQLPRAHAYANALLGVVEPLGIAPLQMAGYILRGTGAIVCATVPEACADLRRALEIADTVELPAPKTAFEIDPLAMGCSTYALALVLAGRPDSAAALVERGVRRARELAHPRTQASALQIGATAFYLADDPRRVGELSDQCIEVVDGRGFHQIEVSARVLGGVGAGSPGRSRCDRRDGRRPCAAPRGMGSWQEWRTSTSPQRTHTCWGENTHARSSRWLEASSSWNARGSGSDTSRMPRLMRARVLLDAGGHLDEVRIPDAARRSRSGSETSPRGCCCSSATLLGRVALETGKRRDEARERLARALRGIRRRLRNRAPTRRACHAGPAHARLDGHRAGEDSDRRAGDVASAAVALGQC